MTEQNDKRAAAIKRVKAKRAFRIHVVIYLVINALLVLIWACRVQLISGPVGQCWGGE
jgi:hypothetical protein